MGSDDGSKDCKEWSRGMGDPNALLVLRGMVVAESPLPGDAQSAAAALADIDRSCGDDVAVLAVAMTTARLDGGTCCVDWPSTARTEFSLRGEEQQPQPRHEYS